MAENPTENRPDVAAAGKERLQRWLLSSGLRDYMQTAKESGLRTERVGPHITVSREAGTGAVEIARMVGQQLDWDVLGKELLDFMSQRYKLPREMLEVVDEAKADWVHDMFGEWFDSRVVSHEKYLAHLERILWLAAIHGKVVIVGRGGNYVLPRRRSLAVRIVAPREFRIDYVMNRRQVSQAEAARIVDSTDADRRNFVQRCFHQDIDNSQGYDLVINAASFSAETATRQIIEAYQQRQSDAPAA